MTEERQLSLRALVAILAVTYLILTVIGARLGYFQEPSPIWERIRGIDPVYYYVYLPSLVLHGDLDFTDDLARFWGKAPPYYGLTPLGIPANVFAVGPALLWLPFFLIAHGISLFAHWSGADVPLDGFGPLYQGAIYIGNSMYGFLGVCLTAAFLRRYVSSTATLTACLGLLLATPLTYYLWPIEVLAHNVSFATVALFLLLWSRRGLDGWTGLAAALMTLCRWQNVLFLLPVGLAAGIDLWRQGHALQLGWKLEARRLAIFTAAFSIGLLPQLLIWHILYGRFLLVPQGSGFIDFRRLHLIDVLFSFRHGLFLWHPLLLAGVAGLIIAVWSRRRIALVLVGAALLQWILNAAVSDWWAGWSYGQRRFINLLPIFAFGIAVLWDRASFRRWSLMMALAGIVGLAVWNQLFLYQYQTGLIPRGETITMRELLTEKFRLPSVRRAHRWSETAVALLYQGNVSGFSQAAAAAYNTEPDHDGVRFLYALAAVTQKRWSVAKQAFAVELSRNPNDGLMRWGLAGAQAEAGDLAQARQTLSGAPSGTLVSAEVAERIASDRPPFLGRPFFVAANERINTWIQAQILIPQVYVGP